MDSLARDEIVNDSHWDPATRVKFATLSLFVGLIFGAAFWGVSADIVGRRFSWNCTLFIGGIFGIGCGAAPTFVAFCCLIACMGFGVGGNLPVDGTMFLEFMPGTHQWLLTFLSIWWAIGQVVASLIARRTTGATSRTTLAGVTPTTPSVL
jgi:MFS family permease